MEPGFAVDFDRDQDYTNLLFVHSAPRIDKIFLDKNLYS